MSEGSGFLYGDWIVAVLGFARAVVYIVSSAVCERRRFSAVCDVIAAGAWFSLSLRWFFLLFTDGDPLISPIGLVSVAVLATAGIVKECQVALHYHRT